MKVLTILMIVFISMIDGITQDLESPLPPRTMHSGYVVNLEGDTVQGWVKFMTVIANQFNVSLYAQESDSRPQASYKPKDLMGYQVGDLYYASVPFSGEGFSRKRSFMIRLIEGPVSLYQWYYDESLMFDSQDLNEAMGREEVLSVELDEGMEIQYFGVRGNEKPVDFSSVKFGMNFKKQMSKYVSDCPELAEKIASRTEGYGYGDLPRIITEYNQWLQR